MKKVVSLFLSMMLVLGTLSVTAFCAPEEPFTIAGALGDDMVLQRDAEICIWGTSSQKGAEISVTFKGKTTSTTVDENGKWQVMLPKESADKNESELTVTLGDYSKTLTGILVGDVYLVGGQSNAELTLGSVATEYKSSQISQMISEQEGMIRYFTQTRNDAKSNKEAMASPQEEPLKGKKWRTESRSTANAFSAMGFFFAHKMVKETDVPMGMIMVASAGSPLSQLMSAQAAATAQYMRYENDIPVSGMYNALMHPFIHMTIKGMIFYQGESEAGLAKSDYGKYNEYMNIYVEDLRQKMDQDFPFYYVQLSSHGGQGLTSWPQIAEQRAVQFDGLSVVKNSGMVVSMDQGYQDGDPDWAHPLYKQPVGERLAALALARDYGIGEEEQVSSPMPEYAYKTEEGTVVHFKNTAGGLKKLGSAETLKGFKAIVATGYSDVEATILNENEVLLKTNSFSGLSGIGYGLELLAFVDHEEEKYIANLGNGSDLPAPTFKITNILDETPNGNSDAETPGGDQTAEPSGNGTNGETSSDTGLIIAISAAVVIVAAAVVAAIIISKKKDKK